MIEIRQAKLARFAERQAKTDAELARFAERQAKTDAELARTAERQAKTAEFARFDARFPRIRELVKQDLIVSNETGSSAHVDTDHQPATHKLMKVPEIEID